MILRELALKSEIELSNMLHIPQTSIHFTALYAQLNMKQVVLFISSSRIKLKTSRVGQPGINYYYDNFRCR